MNTRTTRPRALGWIVAAAVGLILGGPGLAAAAEKDAGAGQWQMIVLAGPTDVSVSPPASVGTRPVQPR